MVCSIYDMQYIITVFIYLFILAKKFTVKMVFQVVNKTIIGCFARKYYFSLSSSKNLMLNSVFVLLQFLCSRITQDLFLSEDCLAYKFFFSTGTVILCIKCEYGLKYNNLYCIIFLPPFFLFQFI